MGNALGIGPHVMINRLVDCAATPREAQLAKVAELTMALELAIDQEEERTARDSPTGEGQAPALSSGAVVDRLI